MKNEKEIINRWENESVRKDGSAKLSRRSFMSGVAAAAAFTIVPRHVLGGAGYTPPSEKLNIAGIGIGGMGKSNIDAVNKENIVALCDVDDDYAARVFNRYPEAKKYHDYRKMLEEQKDIEAVIVATPDHSHAVIAMMAIKMGKHVYCQKPMTHTIYEARKLTEAARENKVATQMGNQGHSGEDIRLVYEWISDGAIGPVREVHAWTNRPVWPQGVEMERPTETPPVPSTLDWDLWLGPAPCRPYSPVYIPKKWRGWWDFGTGALGDMGCHIIDPAFWALKLGHPESVEACGSTYYESMWKIKAANEVYPTSTIVHYRFPARGNMPPVKLTWYDGGLKPERPEELEEGRKMGDDDGGLIFVGKKGKLMCGIFGKGARLIPETKMKAYKLPPKKIPRVGGMESHEQGWIKACKGGEPACSNFDYAGPLTETILLGNLAIRMGKKLNWDGPNMKVTNVPEANEYVHCPYREGWTL